MSWQCILFPPKTPYSEGMGQVLVGFLREFFASPDTKGLALFKSRYARAGAMLYLTPRAAERCRDLVAPFRPQSCEPPLSSEVSLVAGDMSANALLEGRL
ncbi:MAG: hypothetical protein ACREQJ_01890 [Candidatus Binatia bacterium]